MMNWFLQVVFDVFQSFLEIHEPCLKSIDIGFKRGYFG